MPPDSISAPPLVYTLDQVAGSRLPCTVRWLADKLRSGEFVGHRIARTWVLTEDDIKENIRRCAVEPEGVRSVCTTNLGGTQSTSMTPTTARRMRHGTEAGVQGQGAKSHRAANN